MSGLRCYALRYNDLLAAFCARDVATCDFKALQNHWDSTGSAEGRTLECAPGDGPSPEALALQRAVRAGRGVVRIGEGDFYFGNSSLLITGVHQLSLLGSGPLRSRLWFEPGHGVQLVSSHNISVGGFSVDCPQAPFAQGRVVGASARELWIDFELEEGFARPTESGLFSASDEIKAIFWHSKTRKMRRTQTMFAPATRFARTRGSTGYRAWLPHHMPFVPSDGDLITLSPRLWSKPTAYPSFYKGSFLLLNSSKITTENVHIHCSATMTILEMGGDGGHVYRRVSVRRKTRPPYPHRLLASNSDGLHSFSVRSGPKLVDSFFEFLADDFVNMHNRVWPLVTVRGGGAQLLALDPSSGLGAGLDVVHTPESVWPGSKITVYDFKTRKQLGEASVVSAVELNPSAVPPAHVMVAGIQRRLGRPVKGFEEGTGRLFKLWVSPRLKVLEYARFSAFVQFDDLNGSGAVIANNHFTDSYCNLARIATSNALIERNVFSRGQDGVHIRFLPDFLEGSAGLVNITLRENVFTSIRGCGDGACDTFCEDMACILQNVDEEIRAEVIDVGNRVHRAQGQHLVS